jgi:hypothetical protein
MSLVNKGNLLPKSPSFVAMCVPGGEKTSYTLQVAVEKEKRGSQPPYNTRVEEQFAECHH